MRAATLSAVVALMLPAAASAEPGSVNVQFSAFGPSQLDVLPGETVTWENVSDRRHTVNADDGSFASGDLLGGERFAHEFDDVGAFPYHCTVHPEMTGEVDVRRVTLGPLPTAAVPVGDKVEFEGRTADPGLPVQVQRADGTGYRTLATATPAADGTWKAAIAATAGGEYRAASDLGESESRRLLVSDRKVIVRSTRTGIAVTVTPALPYARVVLQLRLRERFGWWPERTARLDYVSEASFRVARPAQARVVLVDKDGWTPLTTSSVVVLGRPPVSRPPARDGLPGGRSSPPSGPGRLHGEPRPGHGHPDR